MTERRSSSATGELLKRLDERIWAQGKLLSERMWNPSRQHIETDRNLLREASDALRASAQPSSMADVIKVIRAESCPFKEGAMADGWAEAWTTFLNRLSDVDGTNGLYANSIPAQGVRDAAFETCLMIVAEECVLDAPPDDSDHERAVHDIGMVIHDRIKCAQRNPDTVLDPVQDTYLLGGPDLRAMSGSVESDRVIQLHFRRPATDADRKWLLEAINAKIAADGSAFPSTDRNPVADSTGSQPGTHGASKEAGGHSRDGLTPASSPSTECGSGK